MAMRPRPSPPCRDGPLAARLAAAGEREAAAAASALGGASALLSTAETLRGRRDKVAVSPVCPAVGRECRAPIAGDAFCECKFAYWVQHYLVSDHNLLILFPSPWWPGSNASGAASLDRTTGLMLTGSQRQQVELIFRQFDAGGTSALPKASDLLSCDRSCDRMSKRCPADSWCACRRCWSTWQPDSTPTFASLRSSSPSLPTR